MRTNPNSLSGFFMLANAIELVIEIVGTYSRQCAVLRRAFDITVTPGGLSQALSRLASRAEPSYAGLLEEVRGSEAVYPDETSARMNGQRWWLWVFATTLSTVYVQRPSRGFDVIEEVLGKDFAGRLGHDGWAPYDKLTDAIHQQCLAHLIRRSESLLETATRGAVRFPRKVKKLLQDALRLRDRWEAKELSEHGFSALRGKLEKRLVRVLEMHITHTGNRKFQAHLDKHADDLLTFLYEDVEATNWPAEQAIRPAVRFRKTSGGHRSPRGARTRDVLLSILRTARQRGLDPLPLFAHMLRSKVPVLIPVPAGS
jgi:transposase